MNAATADEQDPLPDIYREAMSDTDVLHYKLDIEITNINNFSTPYNCAITGTNVMTIQSKSPALSEFTFRLRSQYNITSAVVNGTIPVTVVQSGGLGSSTRVATLDRTYGMDEVFDLTIAYSGTSMRAGIRGQAIYVGTAAGGNPVVTTLSEPYFAYTWWPAKDGDTGAVGDNSDKATAEMSFTVPNTYVVPSNGVLQGVDTLSGNRKRYRWATNYPMATYLLCFSATNYNTWSRIYNYPAGDTYPAGSMPVLFYIYPGNDNSGNRAAWEKCLTMLAVYRPIYGEYPFINEKYGLYNFNFGGGMEHQTMTGLGTFSESTVAHETGHQWWGDMITCKTWSDTWLNEGFATYTECLWEERKGGSVNTPAYLSAIIARKPGGPGGSVYVYPPNTNSWASIFDSTNVYNKGAWVLHQLRHVVGDATFFNVLAAYRAAFQYSAATTDDFAAVASAVSGQDLTYFFNQWVYQIGAPAYQYGWVTANVSGQNYLLARIAQTQTNAGYLNVYQMPVDLRATIGGSPQTKVVKNNARTQWFVVPTSGPVTALSLDPDQWILRTGVTSVAYTPGPPKIVQTAPAPGASAVATAAPSQITLWFHTPVNASQTDFSLVGASVGPQSVTLVSGAGVNPVVLNSDAPLPADTYTLTIADSLTAANSGQQLDGEIADPASPASLPSGDGVAGGAASVQFTITPCNVAGDIDGDCDRDDADIDLFVQVLLGEDTDSQHITRSDLDHNGSPDGLDIDPFVQAQLGP